MTSRLLFIFLLLITFPFRSFSQDDVTGQLWLSFSLNKIFASSFLFYSNPEYYEQTYGSGSSWSSVAWTNGVEYYPNGTFDLYANLYTSYTVQSSNNNSIEIRPVIGGRWHILNAQKRISLNLGTKYESRQFYSLEQSNWSSSHRFRIKLQTRYSVNRQNIVEEKNFILRLYMEEFINADDKIEERYWDTRRFALGLYYRHNPNRRYEIRYIYQGSRDTQDQDELTSTSNILYFLVTFYL